MEKKKLTLSISSTKKTIKSIEEAKSQSKNSVIIEKKPGKFIGKPRFGRPLNRKQNFNLKSPSLPNTNNYSKPKHLSLIHI